MKLRELAAEKFKGKDIREQFIGIFTTPHEMIPAEYADELLETHGDKEVLDHVMKDGVLIVVLEN